MKKLRKKQKFECMQDYSRILKWSVKLVTKVFLPLNWPFQFKIIKLKFDTLKCHFLTKIIFVQAMQLS